VKHLPRIRRIENPKFLFIFQRQLKYKVATSFDSKKYFNCYQHSYRVLCELESFDSNKSIDKQLPNSPPQTPAAAHTTHPIPLER
jgi:hypothetical protein